ncbi:uncharacterized protein LOC117224642 [Megalopta genalis]|uniref:uncharacterized protein LOC117224642 n=1 Tax=Megalopta genalis TaxID=115081 RepID=UPI003FD65297
MRNNKRTVDKLVTHPSPSTKLPPRRKLDRPGDSMSSRLISAWFDNDARLVNRTIMIPIPPEDAKVLGLRIPDSENSSSLESNSSSSKNSTVPSGSRTDGKYANDAGRSSRVLGRRRNADVKATKRLQDSKREEEANEREQAMKKLNGIHAKLKRGLRSMSYKKTNRLDDSEVPKAPECSHNVGPAAALKGGNHRPAISSKFKKSLSNSRKDETREDKKESNAAKSMRQLFSVASSWSTDSIVSHSDNCPCCHSREIRRPRGADVVRDA